jgi:hypothetical protein
MACSLQNETGGANLLLSLLHCRCSCCKLVFDVTMVTGSASVWVTSAYSPSPLKPLISWQMSLMPSQYSSEISIGFWRSTINQSWAGYKWESVVLSVMLLSCLSLATMYDRSHSLTGGCCHSSCGVRHDSWHARDRTWCEYSIYYCIFHWVTDFVDGMVVIVEEKRLPVMEGNEWSRQVKCDFCQCLWGWHMQAGWRMLGREWRFKNL